MRIFRRDSQLRIVILGAGFIGDVHRRAALSAGAEVVAVMASNAARSAEIAAHWGCQPISSTRELSRLGPDVVHVCSPNHLHAEQVEGALNSGAHVICEKPLAIGAEAAHRLRALAGAHERVATVPFVYRYHPLVRELRARSVAGEFGAWHVLHGSYLQDWLLSPTSTSWRVDSSRGGPSRAFADIGSHWCDLMEFVTGERIAQVSAAMSTPIPERPDQSSPSFGGRSKGRISAVSTEDVAALLFRTASGVVGSVVISQVSAGRKNRLWFEFDGALKSAVFDQETPETVWLGSEEQAQILHRDPRRGASEQRRLSSLPPGHPQGYAQCFENFVADTYSAVRGTVPEGLPTFADGVRAASIVDAVIASAHSGRWIEVPVS